MVLSFFSSGIPAQAEGESSKNLQDSLLLYIGSPTAYVKGEKKALDPGNEKVTPVIKDERTLVPVRFISEQLGADVQWIAEANRIRITKDDTEIELTIGDFDMRVNGLWPQLDAVPQLIQDRTYLPLRAVAETLASG